MSEFRPEFLEEFLSTAVERHRIYKKKEAGLPKPWTNNPVMRDFFFCNLFRQYDKCSKWIIEKIVPYGRWDLLILYRFISTYSTFKRLEGDEIPLDDMDKVHEYLKLLKSHGVPLFSGCFIRNPRIPGGWTETHNVPFILIEEIKKVHGTPGPLSVNTLEGVVKELSKFPGTAGFMGYEYACDFAYAPGVFNPIDTMTWANMGPGAQKGMSLIIHGCSHKKFTFKEWISHAREILPLLKARVEKEFPEERVTMREVEHWLCEYQKYRKYFNVLRYGDKVKHRKYEGGASNEQVL